MVPFRDYPGELLFLIFDYSNKNLILIFIIMDTITLHTSISLYRDLLGNYLETFTHNQIHFIRMGQPGTQRWQLLRDEHYNMIQNNPTYFTWCHNYSTRVNLTMDLNYVRKRMDLIQISAKNNDWETVEYLETSLFTLQF